MSETAKRQEVGSDMPAWATVLAGMVLLGLFGAVIAVLVVMGMTIPSLWGAHDYTLAGMVAVAMVLIAAVLIAGGQVPGVGAARTKKR